jgi:hypothetical protein
MSEANDQIPGGGEQGERLEGSLTDGGQLPGAHAEDRSFGAGRGLEVSQPGHTGPQGEGGGAMSGRGQQEGPDLREQGEDAHEQAERNRSDDNIGGGGVAGAGTGGAGLASNATPTDATGAGLGGDAGPSGEQSGYGNTPPRT